MCNVLAGGRRGLKLDDSICGPVERPSPTDFSAKNSPLAVWLRAKYCANIGLSHIAHSWPEFALDPHFVQAARRFVSNFLAAATLCIKLFHTAASDTMPATATRASRRPRRLTVLDRLACWSAHEPQMLGELDVDRKAESALQVRRLKLPARRTAATHRRKSSPADGGRRGRAAASTALGCARQRQRSGWRRQQRR